MFIKRIATYGGPCTGKSTLGAWLFDELKQRDLPVEYVDEFIKPYAWANTKWNGNDGVWIVANQMRLEETVMLNGGTAIATGSPYQSLVYAELSNAPFAKHIRALANDYEALYPHINIGLKRVFKYDSTGRFQKNVDEAKAVDQKLREIVDANKIDIEWFYPTERDQILRHVLQKLGLSTESK